MRAATTQIRRALALAGALAAVLASDASAAPDWADMAARREARAIEAWHAAHPPTIIEVAPPEDGGFDLASAGIGAAVPLTLILVEVAGRWVLRRRRDPARARLA
jgi:hypothetical protein